MRNYLDKRFDVRQLVEGAKTVVVCAVSYKSEISGGYDESDSCKIASYACNRDYHKILKKMLQSLLRELQTQYPQLQGRAFVDSAPLLEKQYAVEAGLGWIGRQSLLITPEYGSYVLLGELVLDMEADAYDAPYEGVGCGECRRCMDACPTSAIVAPMTIDTAKCISCRTIESDNDTNIDLHGWIFGCEECQNCCPYNRQAAMHRNSSFNPLFDPREISAEEWLTMSEEEFLARFGTTPLKRSGVERIKKNIKRG
jgi:epoxyqueuosine reductase